MVATKDKPKAKRKATNPLGRQSQVVPMVPPRVGDVVPMEWTEELEDEIAAQLAKGTPLIFILDHLRIDRKSCYKRLRELPEFAHKLSRARGQFAITNVSRIDKAADKDWRAASWMLERTLPEHFGRQSTTNTNVQVTFRASESPQADFGTIDTEAPDAFIDVSSSESEA